MGNTKHFLSIFKQRSHDNYIQDWNTRLSDSSRALFYRNIASFEYQQYLDCTSVRKFRVYITKLRVSSHRLEVESGRWHKPASIPYNERKCKICNVLEDEYHLMFICPIYKDLRQMYIPKYFRNRSSMFKLIELFQSDRASYIRNLGIFIYKAFELRNEILYQVNRYL